MKKCNDDGHIVGWYDKHLLSEGTYYRFLDPLDRLEYRKNFLRRINLFNYCPYCNKKLKLLSLKKIEKHKNKIIKKSKFFDWDVYDWEFFLNEEEISS